MSESTERMSCFLSCETTHAVIALPLSHWPGPPGPDTGPYTWWTALWGLASHVSHWEMWPSLTACLFWFHLDGLTPELHSGQTGHSRYTDQKRLYNRAKYVTDVELEEYLNTLSVRKEISLLTWWHGENYRTCKKNISHNKQDLFSCSLTLISMQ